MKQLPKVSRRSFLTTVAGAATGGMLLSSDAEGTAQGCSDSDPPPSGGGDPGGRGRRCTARPTTGCSDSDPGDPSGSGRNCQNRQPQAGCSDSDPSDPVRGGRNCGGGNQGGGGGGHVTGRRERTYEVCWVDHPSRSNADCNMQTYTEWATTYSDGRVIYDTADADARKASMTARGYTARWHRMLQNW